MSKYVDGIEFITEQCCNCGMPFAMTADFQQRRRNDHGDFYCPRGHGQHYAGKTEAQRLKGQLDRMRERFEAEAGRAIALEDQRDRIARAHRRMRQRVKNGVCPCCNRTFQNLLQHMKTKHPEFGRGEQLRVLRDAFGLTQRTVAEEAGVSAPVVSYFERDIPVSDRSASRLESWLTEHGEKA